MKNDVTPELLSALRRGIVLCADLGVGYENPGEGLEAKARELISYLNRHGRLLELIIYCTSTRPNYPEL